MEDRGDLVFDYEEPRTIAAAGNRGRGRGRKGHDVKGKGKADAPVDPGWWKARTIGNGRSCRPRRIEDEAGARARFV